MNKQKWRYRNETKELFCIYSNSQWRKLYGIEKNGVHEERQGLPILQTEKRGSNRKAGTEMKPTQIMPTVLIVIDLISAVIYALSGDWRKTTYWIAAAVLNVAVTF